MSALSSPVPNLYSQEQIDYLSSLHFINRIDNHLKIISNVRIIPISQSYPPRVVLMLDIIYDDEKVEALSFDLHDYSYEEILLLAQNIHGNEFILQEVDNYLAGDIE